MTVKEMFCKITPAVPVLLVVVVININHGIDSRVSPLVLCVAQLTNSQCDLDSHFYIPRV